MSCGTCPDSAQPTTRSDGTAPTAGNLLWSADVGAWYREQREKGGQPVVNMPAPPQRQSMPAADPAPRQDKAGRAGAQPIQGAPGSAPIPATEKKAAWEIEGLLAALTAHRFRVTAPVGHVLIHWDTLEEGQQLAHLGITTERRAHNRVDPILRPQEWTEAIRRLRAIKEARILLCDQRVIQEMAHAKRVLLCRPTPGADTAQLVMQTEQAVMRPGSKYDRHRTLHTWEMDAAGTVSFKVTPYANSSAAAAAIETMREGAQQDQRQLCFSCGAPLLGHKSCPQCGSSRDRWRRRV